MAAAGLLGRSRLDHETLWASLRKLLDRLVSALDRSSFLDDTLDALVDLFGADRGLIVLAGPGGGTSVESARGRAGPLSPREWEEVSKSILRKVQTSGKHVVFEAAAEGGGSESVAALGITAALAAPLRVLAWRSGEGAADGDATHGVLYLDIRGERPRLTDLHLEFFHAAAALVSASLEQRQRLEDAREVLREARAKAAPAPSPPTLEELLCARSLDRVRREVLSCLGGCEPIVITGESGTGKTLLAHAMAAASGRLPIVRSVLGSTDDLNTLTSELFGHERGSFSGALRERTGLVEFAHNGTLILDEILNLHPRAQQLLLDFAQFGNYRPLGYDRPEPKRASVRLIAVSNGDLQAALREGRFREDLYYRLAAVRIHLPPLRERREDVVQLVEAFLRRIDPARDWLLTVPLRRLLLSEELAWPGNTRQLESAVRRAVERALARDRGATSLGPEHLDPEDLGVGALSVPRPQRVSDAGAPLCSRFQIEPEELGDSWRRLQREREMLDAFERELIRLALHKHGGVVAHAARELDVARTGLLSRMKTLGVERSDPAS